jgi:hypothetical protein
MKKEGGREGWLVTPIDGEPNRALASCASSAPTFTAAGTVNKRR